jgi:hypothetical protein
MSPRTLPRRRPAAAEEEETETPARARRRAADEVEERAADEVEERAADEVGTRRARRRAADEVEDDEVGTRRARRRAAESPASTRRNKAKAQSGASLGRGLDAYRAQRTANYVDSNKLKIGDKAVLVKFLEPDNFDTYRQHWLEGMPQGVRRSHTCLSDGDPLCDMGLSTRLLTLFNVVNMADGDNYYIEAGPNLADSIADYAAEDEPNGPLDREDMYFSIKRKKKSNGFYEFTVTPVRERDLDEWNTEALTYDELDKAMDNLFTGDDVIQYTPIDELEKIADSLPEE